tara:strand:+ start:429 stop:959 length:531 start_codon:yes stop_codon:yes gene_type:complete
MKITIFVTLMTSAVAFSPMVKPKTTTFNFNGDIAPTGFFDPLRVTENSDERTLKYMREAELHHGRIAMVSSLILPTLDLLNKDELAINVLAKGGSEINNSCLFSMALFEFARMARVYKNPFDRVFEIKDNVQPGQLNPYYSFNETKANKELSNGRLAMLAVVGYMAQELLTGDKIF